ncbi:hypothetical protein [Aeromonas media]|uniref:hypothetical protein n=1 Tax=Aeromonas media TaxID=651 RepID=UPI0038D12D1C
MSNNVDTAIVEMQNMTRDIANGHIIDLHNAREVADISRYAHSNNMYNPNFENRLAATLKHSIEAGVYRRTSLPTPPPASLMTALRSRV